MEEDYIDLESLENTENEFINVKIRKKLLVTLYLALADCEIDFRKKILEEEFSDQDKEKFRKTLCEVRLIRESIMIGLEWKIK